MPPRAPFSDALRIGRLVHGNDDNLDVAYSQMSMSQALQEQGKYQQALDSSLSSLATMRKLDPPNSTNSGIPGCLGNIGIHLDCLDRGDEALKHFQESIKIYQHVGHEEAEVAKQTSNMAGLCTHNIRFAIEC